MMTDEVRFDAGGCPLAGTYVEADHSVAAALLLPGSPDPDSVGPRGYRRAVRQPVSPEVLTLITGWVGQHWGGNAASHAHGTQAVTEQEPR